MIANNYLLVFAFPFIAFWEMSTFLSSKLSPGLKNMVLQVASDWQPLALFLPEIVLEEAQTQFNHDRNELLNQVSKLSLRRVLYFYFQPFAPIQKHDIDWQALALFLPLWQQKYKC